MIRRKYLFAGAGLASFLLFTIANIPASIITNRLDANMPGRIKTGGIEGTFWNGYVRSLNIDGWQLRDTRWDLSSGALLLGRVSAAVETDTAGGHITTDISVSLFGNLSVRDLEATGPIAPIAAKFNLPVTGGRYQVQVSELNITDAWPSRLIGFVQVKGVPLNIMGGSAGPNGNYAIVFDVETVTDDGRLSGKLSDDGGPVEVGGTIILTPPKLFDLQAKLKARPGAPAEITQALNLVGPPDPDGRREFKMSGSL